MTELNRRHDTTRWILPAPKSHCRCDLEIGRDEPTIEPFIFWASVAALAWLAVSRYFGWMPW